MKATPFPMFQGQAQDALALYREALPDYDEPLLQEHPEGAQAGQVAMAWIRVGGLEIMLYGSAPVHDFTFTPSPRPSSTATTKPSCARWPQSSAKEAR